MSQDRPIKIPSIKSFHFYLNMMVKLFVLEKCPCKKRIFLAENDCSIPEDYIQKGNEIQILYGRDCVWQISLLVNRKKIR